MMTDPIADMLTRIRNAVGARHKVVRLPASKIKLRIAEILVEEGYLEAARFEAGGHQGTLELSLRYSDEGTECPIRGLEKVSKPGRRVYARRDGIHEVLNGLGISIVSTSKGVMTDRRAREAGVGGEVICKVW